MGALRSESKAGGTGRAAILWASAPLAAALGARLLFCSLQTEERKEDDLGMLGQSNAAGSPVQRAKPDAWGAVRGTPGAPPAAALGPPDVPDSGTS